MTSSTEAMILALVSMVTSGVCFLADMNLVAGMWFIIAQVMWVGAGLMKKLEKMDD